MVAAQMGLWLLFGFLVAGLLSVFVSPVWLQRYLGGGGFGPIARASLFGVPLPLCSCGVIPVAASLKQHGASRPATTAFLLSTPQTGVDSILVTWTLLGPLMAVFRPIAALLTGLLGGAAVQALDPQRDDERPDFSQVAGAAVGAPELKGPLTERLRKGLVYGFLTLPADIGRALLIGLLVAGVLGAVVPEDFLGRYLGGGPLSIALMMLVGIPIYVCATASVPLAASFIFLGATPGAALAFLIAGPATNAATIATVSRVLGRRNAIIYLASVAVSAFGGGLLLDWLVPRAGEWIPLLEQGAHVHEHVGWSGHVGGIVLAVVMTVSWWMARRSGGCGCDSGQSCEGESKEMSETRRLDFQVEGMNCNHCSGSVDRAVRELPGVEDCVVDLKGGHLTVRSDTVDPQIVVAAVEGLGFEARAV